MSDQLSPQQKKARKKQDFLFRITEDIPIIKIAARALERQRRKAENPSRTFEEMFFPTSTEEKK